MASAAATSAGALWRAPDNPFPLTPLQQRGLAIIARMRRGPRPETPPRAPSGASDINIGIALGGGSARGLSHIPYIEAMDEMGLRPAVIAGTSIGALIGAGWAAGMRGAELRAHAHIVLGTLRAIATRLWAHQVRDLGGLVRNGIPTQLDALSVVDAFIPEGFPETFEALKTPLYVVATDFQSWHQTVFASGPLRPAIAGSIAIPSMFRPVHHAGKVLVDGSVANPLPLDQADIGADFLIGIDVNGDPSTAMARREHGALDIWFGSAQIMMHGLIAHTIAAYPPDLYVRPHVAHFGALEFWRAREIMEHADAEKERFKRLLGARLEAHLRAR